jgi:hypothetical protein
MTPAEVTDLAKLVMEHGRTRCRNPGSGESSEAGRRRSSCSRSGRNARRPARTEGGESPEARCTAVEKSVAVTRLPASVGALLKAPTRLARALEIVAAPVACSSGAAPRHAHARLRSAVATIAIVGCAIGVEAADHPQRALRVAAAVAGVPRTCNILTQAATPAGSTLIVVGAPIVDVPGPELRHAQAGFRSVVATIAIAGRAIPVGGAAHTQLPGRRLAAIPIRADQDGADRVRLTVEPGRTGSKFNSTRPANAGPGRLAHADHRESTRVDDDGPSPIGFAGTGPGTDLWGRARPEVLRLPDVEDRAAISTARGGRWRALAGIRASPRIFGYALTRRGAVWLRRRAGDRF